MLKYGRLRHRCAVAILCVLQVIVSIILIEPAVELTIYRLGDLHIFGWILQASFGLSGLFGLFALSMENSIVMAISQFLLIIVIVLLMILLLLIMIFVMAIFIDKMSALLMGIAWILVIACGIVAHIYATVSASALVKAYRHKHGAVQSEVETAPKNIVTS